MAGTSPVSVGNHTSGSGTHRAIAFVVETREASGFKTVTAGTWNGSAITWPGVRAQFSDATNGNEYNGELGYILDPPASTSGAISLTLSANATRVAVHAINIEGAGPIAFGTIGTNVDDTDPGTTAFSGSISPSQADSLIIASVAQATVAATATWDELTEIAESGSGGGGIRLVTAYGDQVAAGAATYNGDWDTQNEWGMILGSFYETEGGAPPLLMKMSRMNGGFDTMRGGFN